MSTSKRLRVLWLCSWYPSEVDPFSGDFIQRQAEAVSSYADIHVLHAIGSPVRPRFFLSKENRHQGLQEWVAYYPTGRSFQRWISPIRWLQVMWRLVRHYQAAYGLPDLVHVQIPFKSGLIARFLHARYGSRYVVTEHWGIYNDQSADRFAKRSFLFQQITRLGFEKAALSLSVSTYQSRQLHTFLGPVAARTIHNVVNTRFFHPVERTNRPYTFLHVSDWSVNKNPEGIVRAFSRLHLEFPDTRLVLVGGKGVRGEVIRQWVQLHAGNIQCEGEIPYETVAIRMQQADCLVLNSFMENSPCVIGEALCVGLSVIATEVGGVAELMDPDCSLLIPAGDDLALYKAMKEVVQNCEGFGREAVALRAQARFSYETVGQQLYQAYRDVLG